jgi:tetratricopeptide (TPR) repeat protein
VSISRKELKRNQVTETLVQGAEAVAAHQKPIWLGAAAALGIALAFFGWKFYSDRQTLKSSVALEEAMKVFNARIRLPSQPEEPGEITYINEQNKFEDAAKRFAEVAQKNSLTQPGSVARYYAGLCYERLNNNDEAEKWFRETSNSSYEEIAALGRFRLAAVLARKGQNDEAAKLYQQLLQKPGLFVPKPVVMLTLADHYRKTNLAEALKLYTQVKEEFPNTAAAEEAEKRLEALTPKT